MAGSLKAFLCPSNFSHEMIRDEKFTRKQSGTSPLARGQIPSTQNPACCSQQHLFPWKQPLTEVPKPWKYGNMHLNCLEEKVTAYVRAPTMAFCPRHNSSCKEQKRHLFSGTTEQIICQLQINRYLQTRPVIKGCLNHLAYFLQEV